MGAEVVAVRRPSPDVVTAGGSGDRETVSSSVVEAARAGDGDAFMVIYDAYATRLRGLAFRTLGDPDLVDDAMQDRTSAGTRGKETSS